MGALNSEFTPNERMAEIRRLVRDLADLDARFETLLDEAVRCPAEERDRLDGLAHEAEDLAANIYSFSELLLEHLKRAEARGVLGECEGFLSVTYGGRA